MSRYDVIIVGAGAAGLNALRLLHNAGRKVLCLEARDRLGGRIYTVRDHRLPLPIELGPEFIHGRPPQTWNLIRQAGLAAYDCEGSAVHLRHGTPFEPPESWDQIDEVTEEMKRWEARGQETTFDDFLHRTNFPPAIQESARNYVEGFNAARSERISIASLAQDARAAEAIGGDSNFRIANGYDAIPQFLASGLHGCIRMGEAVEAVVWQPREVRVTTRSCLSGSETTYTASQIIVTVPLGVLQARSIRFSPVPEAQLMAADRLCFGQVVRMVALFRRAWWEDIGHLSDSGFWLSDEKYVPTWWTALPFRSPLLVGWSSGPHADQLIGKTQPEQLHIALLDLARVTQTPVEKVKSDLERFLCHDWSVDPYALGAYSYVPAGAMDARAALAEPLLGTVYFAGEATDLHGHSATVHGALATGERAARAILSL